MTDKFTWAHQLHFQADLVAQVLPRKFYERTVHSRHLVFRISFVINSAAEVLAGKNSCQSPKWCGGRVPVPASCRDELVGDA